jgi:hypothetical protein
MSLGLNVRFGSQADMCGAKRHVRFAPNSDHESGHPMVGRRGQPKALWGGVRCQKSFVAARRSSLSTDGGAPKIPDLLLKD